MSDRASELRTASDPSFELRPIGEVVAGEEGFALRIDERFRDALTGLEGFSHLNVLFWCHLLDEPDYRAITIAERPYRDAPDRLGIFATRSPARPNPIALTPVPVISIDQEQGLVRIPFIDAEAGSPVLDIKPYHPAVDRIREVAVPEWCAGWPEWYEDSATFDWGAVFDNAR
jgi:tRNA-Thr(GGU) m(6)t(6)A37 methyltransferase TsaA